MLQQAETRDLTDTESRIIDAAIDVILKFGPKKTTMNDIAEAADLTRQTVYVGFGNKDKVLAETVRYIGRQHLAQLAVAWDYSPNLAAKLKAYTRIVVLESHDENDADDDPQELVSAYCEAGRRAYQEVRDQHAAMWTEHLTDHEDALRTAGIRPDSLARFIVATCFAMKACDAERGELHERLDVFHAAILALAARR